MPVSGQQLQLDPGGLQTIGERHQLGGVTCGPLELVHGEEDRLSGRGRLDVAAQRERGLKLGTHLDAGGDLLGEDPGAPGGAQSHELAVEFLALGGAARVPDPDRRRGRADLCGRHRRQRLPGCAGPTSGRDGYLEEVAQRGHQDEPGGVVLGRDLPAPGAARRGRHHLTCRAVVRLDGIGRLIRGQFHPASLAEPSRRTIGFCEEF